jgi:hypothetical protein
VTGDITKMSAICFRVSPSGNLTYSPIFNWSGMFNYFQAQKSLLARSCRAVVNPGG